MNKLLHILLLFLTSFISFYSKADSWFDPTWKDMVKQSDVIALVQYTSSGDFRATAKPIKLYKGEVDQKEIWISGFSNRYGPINEMGINDQYIVFLNKHKLTETGQEYWKKAVKKDTTLLPYFNAIKTGYAFYVPTPTSGDLKVKNDSVQYDLLKTTYYSSQSYYSLNEFSTFLEAIFKPKKAHFHNSIISKLTNNINKDIATQYLMMLYLTTYTQHNSSFNKVIKISNPNSCYALAKLLGQIEDNKSRNLLIKLLSHNNSLVQGEAVRQLAKEEPEFIGPLLLSHLKTTHTKGLYPSNIMDPVMNRIDGGKTEIIRTLGEIKYKPAVEQLLPLLNTKNEYLFRLTIETLQKLESKAYVPYLNKILESGSRDFILNICFIITENELTDCIPSLMKFISTHDKTIHPSMEYTISTYSGLAHFSSDTIKEFLYNDFLNVLKMKNGGTIDNKKDWINEYISVFEKLEINKPKRLLYDFMFEYYGFNHSFKSSPKHFERKKHIEDSLSSIITNVLAPIEPNVKVFSIAFIDSNLNTTNYSIKYQIETPKNFSPWGTNKLDSLNNVIFKSTSIDKSHLIWSTNNYSGSDGAKQIVRFNNQLMNNFLSYISKSADKSDIVFLENLLKYNYANSEYEINNLKDIIIKAKKHINAPLQND